MSLRDPLPAHAATAPAQRSDRGPATVTTPPSDPAAATANEPAAFAIHNIGGGATIIDLYHQGQRAIIGVGVLALPDGGIALVDPGPEARLPSLRAGLEALGHTLGDIRAILLTHIHLDHATATGAILREAPGAFAYVHSLGSPHMVDPSRLLASAGRIYGDAMGTLWGRFLPVAPDAIIEVDEGVLLGIGGRRFQVAYVPGHARHHVAWLEAATGTAWVGDVGGIRIGTGPVLPVTPPPDIDVAQWKASMERVMAWEPERIVATHFGSFGDPPGHFTALGSELDAWAAWVRNSLGRTEFANDAERARAFAAWVTSRLDDDLAAETAQSYRVASGFPDSWWGLARYWRKRGLR